MPSTSCLPAPSASATADPCAFAASGTNAHNATAINDVVSGLGIGSLLKSGLATPDSPNGWSPAGRWSRGKSACICGPARPCMGLCLPPQLESYAGLLSSGRLGLRAPEEVREHRGHLAFLRR